MSKTSPLLRTGSLRMSCAFESLVAEVEALEGREVLSAVSDRGETAETGQVKGPEGQVGPSPGVWNRKTSTFTTRKI